MLFHAEIHDHFDVALRTQKIASRDTIQSLSECELKKRAALAYDRNLRVKLRSLEGLIGHSKKRDEIRIELADMLRKQMWSCNLFDDWIDLSATECQRAINKQTYLYDTWKIIHTTAVQEIKRLKDETESVYSRKSHHSRTSTKSGSSKSSCRETLISSEPGELPCKKSLSSQLSLQNKRTNQNS